MLYYCMWSYHMQPNHLLPPTRLPVIGAFEPDRHVMFLSGRELSGIRILIAMLIDAQKVRYVSAAVASGTPAPKSPAAGAS